MKDLTPIPNDLPTPGFPGLDLFVQTQMLATIFSAVTYGMIFAHKQGFGHLDPGHGVLEHILPGSTNPCCHPVNLCFRVLDAHPFENRTRYDLV